MPLSLARCPASARFAIFEIGMNHAGEIEPLVKMVRPHVAIITTVEPVHLEFFAGIEAIADAKAEIFAGRRARRRGGAQPRQFAVRPAEQARARSSASPASSRSAPTRNPTRGCSISLQRPSVGGSANILGHDVTYKLGMPGRHMAMNSLAVLAAASLAGADLALAALSLSQVEAAAGRGVRRVLELGSGEATLIDESYNANPASMAAALNVLGRAAVGPQGVDRGTRRHARTRSDRSILASRPCGRGEGQRHRSGLIVAVR